MELTHASFFSGVGGLDLGLERAGWRTVTLSEVDPYANAVLAEHFPDVPNLGDITALAGPQPDGQLRQDDRHGGEARDGAQEPAGAGAGWRAATLWSGGFPCQDLSVAGKRRGMGTADERTRSGLAFAFLDLVERHRPAAILLENVPGLLSSHRGKDFGALLGRLGELGYWWAYRVLDAQHFGVPQRRRRVFIVALHTRLGLGADGPGEVLSVGARCARHPATGHPKGAGAAEPASRSTDGAGGPDVAGSLSIGGHVGIQPNGQDAWSGQLVARSLTAERGQRNNATEQNFVASGLRASDGHHGYSSPRGDGADNLVAGAVGARPYDDRGFENGQIVSEAPDPGGVRAPDGVAGRVDDRPELAPTLVAPDTRREPGDGPRQDGSRTDRIPVTLAPTLRVGPARTEDGGPGDTVPITVAPLLAGTGGAGQRTTDVNLPLTFVKRRRAQSDEDDETWGEGDTMPTLNSFDTGDQRATAAVIGDGPQDEDPLLPPGLDSNRYRCCGNGVVADVSEWVGGRLRAALEGL